MWKLIPLVLCCSWCLAQPQPRKAKPEALQIHVVNPSKASPPAVLRIVEGRFLVLFSLEGKQLSLDVGKALESHGKIVSIEGVQPKAMGEGTTVTVVFENQALRAEGKPILKIWDRAEDYREEKDALAWSGHILIYFKSPAFKSENFVVDFTRLKVKVDTKPLMTQLNAASPFAVECAVKDDADKRIFRLEEVKVDKAVVWAVSLRSAKTDGEWVRLELRNKHPKLEKNQVAIDYRSPLGATLKWNVEGEKASFEASINYELEVNDSQYRIPLSAQVDLFNTEKPITHLSCTL